MSDDNKTCETANVDAKRKRWVAPMVVMSAVTKVTAAKTNNGVGFETHTADSLNGS